MDSPSLQRKKAFSALIAAGFMAGSGGLFIKQISLSPSAIAWMRLVFPSILLAAYLFWKGVKIFRGNYRKMLFASVLNAVRMFFFVTAYVYTSVGNAAIMFYSFPIFATILEVMILKEKVSMKQVLLLLLAFSGLVVAYAEQSFSFANQDFLGMGAAIISALIYSLTVIIFKTESQNYAPLETVFFQNIAGALLFLPAFFVEWDGVTSLDLGYGFGYAFTIGILVFGMFFYGLQSIKASVASAVMYLEVVSAIVLSYFFLGEALSINMILGGSMILGASFLISRLK